LRFAGYFDLRQRMRKSGTPFPGLELSVVDQNEIAELKQTGALRERDWRRVRILELLHIGWNLTHTGQAVGTYPREVRRVGWRYLEHGLHAALTDDPRPSPPALLDHRDESAIVAMVCSEPPDGRARWTVRLVAEEVRKRGIVKKIERESVRKVLAKHDLKPWRKKMWCVPRLDEEYVARMEDVLNTLARPPSAKAPVVALDERPVQLLDAAREGTPCSPQRIAREDYEYVRRGVANVYCIVAPHEGRHLTHATVNRKGRHFARALQKIAACYPTARTIHLIMDNLNIHREKSVITALGPAEGAKLWRRFTVHHTPKHASWLNPAEIEVSLVSRECLGWDRVGSLKDLRHRVRVWNREADRKRRKIKWKFRTADARRVFKYE
jgi:hypothetical protein